MSDFGKIRLGQKSLLLSCFDSSDQPTPPAFDCKIFDGAAVVHFLSIGTVNTFADYADLCAFSSTPVAGVDFVWDRYLANSTKGLTREHRGSGSRTKVSPQRKIPKKWGDFLRDSRNKTELFSFLTEKVTSVIIPESKIIFITLGMCLHRILHIM